MKRRTLFGRMAGAALGALAAKVGLDKLAAPEPVVASFTWTFGDGSTVQFTDHSG